VGLFDWLRLPRARGEASSRAKGLTWRVYVDGPEIVAEDSRGSSRRASLLGARSVRVVPLTGGNHHVAGRGWQVTLSRAEGDVLVGAPLADWRSARDLARLVCERTEIPLDELTERLFSRVGAAPQL
jgi:hypothetical protein